VLRARIVERCEGSNSTHHDDVQAFGVLISTLRTEEYARHLPSTDQLPATEQTLSANVASGRATACVNEERIDVRSIRHGPGTPGWEGPEQERNVRLVNANASQRAVGSGPPGDDDDDDDEEDYGGRGSGRGPGGGTSRSSRRGAESYRDHEFCDSRHATDYMLWSKAVASAFDIRVKKAPRAFSGNLDDGNSYSDWKCVFSRITGRNGLDARDPGMLICLLGSATCDRALTFLASDVLCEGTSKPKRIDYEMPATTISRAFERIEAYFLDTPARAQLREKALGLELGKVQFERDTALDVAICDVMNLIRDYTANGPECYVGEAAMMDLMDTALGTEVWAASVRAQRNGGGALAHRTLEEFCEHLQSTALSLAKSGLVDISRPSEKKKASSVFAATPVAQYPPRIVLAGSTLQRCTADTC
jgi:hypothetical protein